MKNFLPLPALFICLTLTAQTDSGFIAHEWGTFTTLQSSNGKRLSGLQREEEYLPYFVQNISFEHDNGNRGYTDYTQFSKVTVKMETPVIYFYSDKERTVTVDVHFKQGSISQWYPDRINGEDRSFHSYLDFSQPRTGWIKWNATVLHPSDASSPNDFACCTYNNGVYSWVSHPEWETSQWISPRGTASNLVKGVNGEIEKFLFYRGIANFEVPVKVEFNSCGKLVITNNYVEKINYLLVYEKKDGQQANIWWSGDLDKGSHKVICPLLTIIAEAELNDKMKNFEDNLVDAGLYRDEAQVLLDTWKKSYFEDAGLKVFWIVPRSLTDNILPITITPAPDKLERVMVGRSEVLTKEFEQTLKQETSSEFWNKWSQDRFYEAYMESRNDTIIEWTDINEDCATSDSNNSFMDCPESPTVDTVASSIEKFHDMGSMEIFPNPFNSEIYFKSVFENSGNVKIQIFNSTGSEVMNICEYTKEGNYSKTISTNNLAGGIYFVRIKTAHYTSTKKIIKE